MAKTYNLRGFFEGDDQDSAIGKRISRFVASSERAEAPPFPRQIQIETSNICNHACDFCAYTVMGRPKRHMDRQMFSRLVREAYDLGSREIGLFAGAEPLTCKWLDEYIDECKSIGYEYTYISTNGSLATHDRLKSILDAGLDSIKFSVNAGTSEVYKIVHGKDDFEKVCGNIRYVSEYRKSVSRKIYLAISFVGTEKSNHTYQDLVELMGPYVDEVIYYEAANQSGQMDHLPPPPFSDCSLLFNKLHVSVEGYIKACCNDYENLLAIEDLATTGLAEAWHSERFKALRRGHLDDKLEGNLCGNCIRGCKQKPSPLNDALYEVSQKKPSRRAVAG